MRRASLLGMAMILTTSLAFAGGLQQQGVTPSRSTLVQGPAVQITAEVKSSAQLVARGFALALNERELRAQVRDSMKASRWNEHKLVLQDFAKTPTGQKLTQVAGKRLNVAVEDLEEAIATLPALDFYVAYREHRTTWRATPDFLVAATFDSRAPVLVAYDRWGNSHELKLADGIPNSPLIILHPAEPKFKQAAEIITSNEVIEGRRVEPSQDVRMTSSASTASGYYYLHHYNIQAGDGWFGGDCEMEFRSYGVGTDYSETYLGTVARSGAKQYVGYNVDIPLPSPPPLSFYTYFLLYLFEMDGPTSDDFYGGVEYFRVSYPVKWPNYLYYKNEIHRIDRPDEGDGGRSAWIGLGYR